ncbi:hypothetical protein SAMN05428975_1135 [Mucilaginibacter sp. OK268]|jgi:hypothetical protein|uniref:hypothetical protein n=1 Tax=Mucilaginibacter sp. OK268 TaxID=1881048 RepID=UPI00088AE9D6|nr:hypothetical protein [Mucilaginibacter sp. OK268]SDP31924.1 hypothetical protein SAMN05428975_1135 [Mucilaginibacter sp. OK268]
MEEGPCYRNQISNVEKVIAGILLSLLTLLALVTIIAFWPDKLPSSGSTARYDYRLFNVTLLDSACINYGKPSIHPISNTVAAYSDTAKKVVEAGKTPNVAALVHCTTPVNIRDTIQFNTLMLLLVAVSGFLGNMVHISTSFTTFIGAGQFKRSWLLWYCVKPFTAAALAVIVYFAFRAGFLNSNDPGNTLNIYGIMTISALAGLFTDIATQKLKEIFEVIFRPKEARPDSLKDDKVTFVDTNPEKLNTTQCNDIVIAGENLDKKKWIIKINGAKIADEVIVTTPKLIHFTYSLSETDRSKGHVILTVASGLDTPEYTYKWDLTAVT